MSPTQTNHSHPENVRLASGINLLLGLWFFVSPWIYGAWHAASSWNSWIFGALIAIFAAIRVTNPEGSPFFSWLNMLFGIWAFVSPWVYNYTGDTSRFVNSLCVGVLVFLLSIVSLRSTPTTPVERPI